MSLATRCTACGTIFRVVEDQLRVSDGWVRCGRCAEVFDARELLFDIERDSPPAWPVAFTPSTPAPLPAPLPPAPPEPEPEPEPEPPWPAPAPVNWSDDETPTRHEPRWVDEPTVQAPWHEPDPEPVLAPASPPAPSPAPSAAAEADGPAVVVPDFMRRAEAGERWRRPSVSLALGVAASLLLLALGLQAALHWRDALAALHPPTSEPLTALCRLAGCEVKPWRRIEALSIDATSLNPIGSSAGGTAYRLNLSLRNKTGVDVAAPWVELSLTDASGAPLARRVIAPEALTPVLSGVRAESEQALSLAFSTGSQRVSGYSVNIFYP